MHGKGRWHWLGKTLLAIAALALLAVGSQFALRLIIPTESDRAALAWLERPHEIPTGSNAFAALWALPYDLPAEAIAPLAAEDVRRAGELVDYVPVAGTGDDTPSGAPKSPVPSMRTARNSLPLRSSPAAARLGIASPLPATIQPAFAHC